LSYWIYQTEGIILGKRDVGEADRIFSTLTKDFGRIDAMAQGVRYLKSKLRYNLDIFSYSRLGLVATNDSWRIVDAEELNNWPAIRTNAAKLAAVSRIADLINRMVRGQDSDPGLWDEVENAFVFLNESKETDDKKNLHTFELLTQLKILSLLGYAAEREKWLNLSLDEAGKMKIPMESLINRALQESQL
jgi:DNA repair protein RecO (recombination protein O)